MKCVQTTSSGGPVLSLEVTDKPDAMAIVWMSISTPHNPIDGYRVYLNGQMCGNQVTIAICWLQRECKNVSEN